MQALIPVRVTSYKNENHFTAMFNVAGGEHLIGVVGCPCGSSNTVEKAVADLLQRTNMESKTAFTRDCIVVEHREY